jgi:hypothetical protein
MDPKIEISKFKADETQAQSWIARHPGWTLAIGAVQLLIIVWLAFKHL